MKHPIAPTQTISPSPRRDLRELTAEELAAVRGGRKAGGEQLEYFTIRPR